MVLPFQRVVHWNEWSYLPLSLHPFVSLPISFPFFLPILAISRLFLFFASPLAGSPRDPRTPSFFLIFLLFPSPLVFVSLSLSLSFFFCTSSSVSLSLTLSSQLLASRRLPRIRQDYLSFSKGRSRLNLKHHLNKREVTAPCYELH